MDAQPLRSSDIRERNEKIILGLIRSRKRLSQSEAVQLTGLRAPTVFRIFSALERKGCIRTGAALQGSEQGSEDRKGRKPQFFEVVGDAFYALGIDFWAGSATVTVCDFSGNVLYTDEKVLAPALDAAGLLAGLFTLVEGAYRSVGLRAERVLGFGVGAPGRIDLERGVVLEYPRIAGLDGFPLAEKLADRFGVRVYLHNNASLIALAEQRYGAASDSRSLLTLLVRSGVGGAYLEDGKPFTVLGRSAMEVGHMKVDCDGPPCSCGARGCLEAYLAEEGILSFVPPRFRAADLAGLEAALITDREELRAALAEPLDVLQRGARTLYTLFAPESFLIVSRSAVYAEFLADHLRRTVADLKRLDGTPVRILSDAYDAGRIGRGAADLVFERYLG